MRLLSLTPTTKALSWKLIERGGSKALRLLVQIILARLLLPSDFGILAIVIVFISLGDILVNGGMNSALIQSEQESPSYYSTAFWLSVIFAAIVFFLLQGLAPTIASLYGNEALENPLRLLALQYFPLAFNSIQVAKTTKHLNLKPVFIGSISAEVVSSCIAIFLAFAGCGVWSLVVQQLSSAILACCFIAIMVRWRPSIEFDKVAAQKLLSFGWRAMATDLLTTISTNLYTLILGKLYSIEQLGFYSQGQRYPLACSDVLVGALTPVLLADFSQKDKDGHINPTVPLGRAERLALLVLCPCFFGMILFADEIILLLLTEKWLPCVPIFQLFCTVALIRALTLIQRQALFARGDASSPLRIALIKLPASLCLLSVAYYYGEGITSSAIAWLGACLIEQVSSSFFCRRTLHYSISQQARDCLLPVALTGLPLMVSAWFKTIQIPVFINLVLFAALSFLVIFAYVKKGRLIRN